ncbi:MAG: phosphomannose isomerase type II C-terminal cupin domain [candidate division NC10 bacterium]|nr:phosphomannose isomerase type II C-terminal cupin domain [candidate division NC10 bacterium]
MTRSRMKLSQPDSEGTRSHPIEFEVRPWGSFSTLEEGPGYKIKRLVVQPGCRLSLQKHRHRAEHWVVVAGTATVIKGNRRLTLRGRQCTVIPRQAWHRIENRGREPVVIIEVQHGAYLGEDDIIRKQDDYGRIEPRAASREPSRRTKREPRAASREPSRRSKKATRAASREPRKR